MKALDGRHRWEVTSREGARVTHTCRACGVSQTFEKLIPDGVVDALLRVAGQPNPYREMFGVRP